MMLHVFSDPESGVDPESTATKPDVGTAVMVSMFDDHQVICPPHHLDLEMTEVLVVAAASAVTSGATVMIDLDPDTASDELIARRPVSAAGERCVNRDGGPVRIIGPGYVRLATRDSFWTIDLTQGRMVRSDQTIDPHFVGSGNWTHIHAVWLTPTDVTALTVDGTYLSTCAAWSIRHQTASLAPA